MQRWMRKAMPVSPQYNLTRFNVISTMLTLALSGEQDHYSSYITKEGKVLVMCNRLSGLKLHLHSQLFCQSSKLKRDPATCCYTLIELNGLADGRERG